MEFLATIQYYLPERSRWAVVLQEGQPAAVREDQITILAPAGQDASAALKSSGCCRGQGPKPAEGCCKDKVERQDATTAGGSPLASAGCATVGSKVWEGVLDDEAQALVELVAKTGLGDWEGKQATLAAKMGDSGVPFHSTAYDLKRKWDQIAPAVKARLDEQPVMPCNHTCNTCPTKHDCHLEAIFDMEDFGKKKSNGSPVGKGTVSKRPQVPAGTGGVL
mmetsp:Transcript_20888/g.57925  ORF Transcript_20888/g.57925 Transcript_20888/m.57925 type:complete len:221 (+) Transcript_20888:542-1204(+)